MYYIQPTYNSNLGVTASSKRTLKSGREYDVLFPRARSIKRTVEMDADVYETLDLMQQVVSRTLDQTKAITKQIQQECGAKDGPIFYKALFDFVFNHIQYVEDEAGYEDLSEPAYLWHNRSKGGDCDCFTIFILSCLSNAGVANKYARIIRLADKNGKPKDYFQHVYVVVGKSSNANMNDASQYWVIDPVMDEFNKEPELIVEKFDKPMVQVRVLSGLGSTAAPIDTETKALLAERELIRTGKAGICGLVHRENAIAAIDYYLKYSNNPKLKLGAIKVLQDRVGQILLDRSLGAISVNDVANQAAYRGADAVVPGSGVILQAIGIKPSNILNSLNPFNWGSGDPNANNAAQRAVLDKFTVPADFDIDKYYAQNPDVGQWANQQGLNSAEYVRKQIAWHWFNYGKNENPPRPYPYKPGTWPAPVPSQQEVQTQGVFDWVGSQDNGLSTGFHIGPNQFRPGNKIRIKVKSGDTRYSGVHLVKYLGADDGSYKDSIVTVAIPRPAGAQQASGVWEAAEIDAKIGPGPSTSDGISKTTLYAGLALLAGGLIAVKTLG